MNSFLIFITSVFLLTNFSVNSELLLNNKLDQIKTIQQPSQFSNENEKATLSSYDTIPVYNFKSLEPLLYTVSKKIHIVNFWAMWCAPCVKELPYLEEYAKNNPDVELLLVSLDFAEDIDSKLIPFLKEKGIASKVVLLDDADANSWIDKVYPKWSGAIPFTIIFNNSNRSFHEKEFESTADLQQAINTTISKK